MILSTVVIRQLVSRDEHIWLETIICLTVAQTRIVSMDVTMSRMKKKMFFFQTWKKMNYLHSQNLQVPLTLVGSLQFICVKQWMTHAFYVKFLKKHMEIPIWMNLMIITSPQVLTTWYAVTYKKHLTTFTR